MADDQPGLRLRMAQEARRISSQHRQLDALYAMLCDALQAAVADRARTAFLRFRDALEAHMSLEDELHFPALNGLRPELERELAELAREHHRFREDLDGLAGVFARSDLDACARQLDRFVGLFAAHERREERLLERLRAPSPGTGS